MRLFSITSAYAVPYAHALPFSKCKNNHFFAKSGYALAKYSRVALCTLLLRAISTNIVGKAISA